MTGIEAWAVICGTVLGTVLATQCAGCQPSPLTPADNALLGAYADEQTSCVVDNRGDAGAIDACRATVKHFYDAIQRAKFGDGGGQ